MFFFCEHFPVPLPTTIELDLDNVDTNRQAKYLIHFVCKLPSGQTDRQTDTTERLLCRHQTEVGNKQQQDTRGFVSQQLITLAALVEWYSVM